MTTLDDKLKSIHFNADDNWQHITVTSQNNCQECIDKQCLSICPTGVFTAGVQKDDPIIVWYKQCVECGACRLVCSNIDFSYPRGGFGVTYLEG
jgi:ferredoxin like protein